MSTPGLPEGYALESQPQQQAPAASGLPAGYTVESDEPPPPSESSGAPLPQVTPAMNPKLAAAMAQKDASPTAGTIALAAPVALAGAAGEAALPAVLPHTIEGVKAIGTWASKNPFQAWALYNVVKEFVPGVKKALGLVKSAPTGQ